LTPSQNFPDGKIALFAAEFFIRFTHYPATLGTRRFECSKITLNCFTLMTFCLLNDMSGHFGNLFHESIALEFALLDLPKLKLPVSCQLGGNQFRNPETT